MISDFTRNIQENVTSGNIAVQSVYNHFPKLYTSKSKLNNLFFNLCSSQIDNYSTCLQSDYKSNVEQFVDFSKRKECWNQWNSVSNCAKRNMGETYSLWLNTTRKIQKNDNDSLNQYNQLIANQLKFLKEDMPVEGEE